LLSTLYAAAVRRRRERYASRPELRLRLRRPVISVGNLAVGGRGKTPVTAYLARTLLEMGERPAILSRGYGRSDRRDGVVVVRDPDGIRADLPRAGDEPLMLARQLPGVSVLTCPDRYLAGRLAEHHLGATVHVLDDGFQHLRLDRDVDLLILGREDVAHATTLPGGRLREPLDTVVAADAILTEDEDVVVDAAGDPPPLFRLHRSAPPPPADDRPVLALAGIASPDRFFDDLRRAGWALAATLPFRDHHRYSARDIATVTSRAQQAGAARIVTTEKDLVRLLRFRPFALPVEAVPLRVEPVAPDEFRAWIAGELRGARDLHV
jgi:tetraacyldisaccharide 4'-kinase